MTTSSRSGSLRPASAGTTSSRVAISSSWVASVRAGQPKARARPATSTPKPGHGAVPPCCSDEAVHHGVPAVREDHEQRPGAVVRRAPERLDRVERRAVADEGDHRTVRARHPDAGRRRKREAEAPHGGAEHAERLPRRQAHEQLRTVGRRLLEDDRVVREPIGDRGEDVPGAERLAGPRGLRGLGALERLRRRGLSCGHGARERRAHRPRRGEHREVGRAAMHLGRVLADHDDRACRARRTAPARRRTAGTPARRPRSRGRAARAPGGGAPGRPARCPANSR